MNVIHSTGWLDIVLRLGVAVLVGGMVGLERQLDRKPAGLRTHMLVSLGAATFVMTSIQVGMGQVDANAISRIMQGIISGVGFLGAGEIFSKSRSNSEEVRIQGLTSAAAIWVSASLGAAVGCGLWFMALSSATATVLILWLVKKLEAKLNREKLDL
jgi:putative Mg2+ transporter-C (MgtC) family protein